MKRYCSTGQSPQRAVAPTEEEEEEEENYFQPRTIRRERLQARQTDINARIEDLKY
jgi:hypothetical protein